MHQQKKYPIYTILTILLFTFCLFSCEKKVNDVIPPEKFTEILTDIHRTDAIMSVTGMNDRTLNADSLSYYDYIFIKHKINKEQFIKSVEYYSSNPKEYVAIYNKIIDNMGFLEQEMIKKDTIAYIADTNDIWNKQRFWNLPKDGESAAIDFKIETSEHGVYTLSADIRMYIDDGTDNPRMSIYATYADGSVESNRNSSMLKDGVQRNYTVILRTNTSKELVNLYGWVLDHSDNTTKKHSDVYNITLKHTKD